MLQVTSCGFVAVCYLDKIYLHTKKYVTQPVSRLAHPSPDFSYLDTSLLLSLIVAKILRSIYIFLLKFENTLYSTVKFPIVAES